MTNNQSIVNAFYLAYYGRPADPGGLDWWTAQLAQAGGNVAAIAGAFVTSQEATERFGDDTLSERVAAIYQQLFDRAPDANGLAYWTAAIETGRTTLAALTLDILQGARGSDVAISAMRAQAAADFTAAVARSGLDFEGYASIEASRTLIAAVRADRDADSLADMVEAAVTLSDVVHDNPAVLAALGTGGELVPLFATTRGRAEPAELLQALGQLGRIAADDPAILASLLRGGGMNKVLDAMPRGASLHDFVLALDDGGLAAAIELVYPTPAPSPTPTPTPAPTFKFGFENGVLTLSGSDSKPVSIDLSARTLTHGGTTAPIGGGTIVKVMADAFAGAVTLSGTVGQLGAVMPLSGQVGYEIADSKAALFTGAPGARTLAPGIDALVAQAASVTLTETLSAQEFGLLTGLPGFDRARLHAEADLVAPAILHAGFGPNDGVLSALEGIELQLGFDAPVAVDGAASIRLANGGVATYVSGSGTDSLVFRYVAQQGHDTPLLALAADGALSGVIVDRAGNPMAANALDGVALGGAVAVDTVAPAAPGVSLHADTGSSAADKLTKSGLVQVTGLEGAIGSTWEYAVDGGSWVRGGVVAAGRSSLAVTGDGAHSVLVRQLDAAGNVSSDARLDFVLDTEDVGLNFDHVEGATTSNNVTTLARADVVFGYTGVFGIGDRIAYRIGDGAWQHTSSLVQTGPRTITLLDFDLSASDPTLQLRVTDVAGNESISEPVHIDGPFVVPPLSVTPTGQGLLVASPEDGGLYLSSPSTARYVQTTTGGGALAGETVLLGAQAALATGIVIVKPTEDSATVDPAWTEYTLGTNGGDAIDGVAYAWGFDGDDTYTGTAGNDVFYGGAGNDYVINAGAGDDYLDGGAGNDNLVGGPGNDTLIGGEGVNRLVGGQGADVIDVRLGENTLLYTAGASTVNGGMDTVIFADTAAANTSLQTFHFSTMPARGYSVDGVANPGDASNAALVSALNGAYQTLTSGAATMAVTVEFANHDTYLVVDTGDGVIDGSSDYVIKLVGYVWEPYVMNGDVVFGPIA